MKKMTLSIIALGLVGGLTACTAVQKSSADYDKLTAEAIKTFHSKGIAKVERLQQDDSNRLCSQADVAGKPLDAATAKAIEEANMKAMQWPSDGKFLGDWKQGNKIAESGKGMTWKDKTTSNNGGNCYNCHQITKEQVSYGTLGPSLYNYGKLRGVTDPNSPASKAVVEYTWGKIWNARAYNACSNMPRAGHNGVLDQDQVRHLVALLLDPNSPVNK
ncbi:MAG: sulfur oxidation c-type cytochrome SoxX [Pseudomonadota bacterium]|jgi:sulfur-oxidizing protein SoxX